MEKKISEKAVQSESPAVSSKSSCDCSKCRCFSWPMLLLLVLAAVILGGMVGYLVSAKSNSSTSSGQVPEAVSNPNPSLTDGETRSEIVEDTIIDPDSYLLPFPNKNNNPNLQACYILDAYEENGRNFILADYVQWLTGEVGNKAALESGDCAKEIYDEGRCLKNGYIIVNKSHMVTTLEVSNNPRVEVFTYEGPEKVLVSKEITFDQFVRSYRKQSPMDIYLVQRESDGVAVLVQNQYRP